MPVTKVTDHYGIHGSVPFVDVDIDIDNRLYVDPHAVRLSGHPQPFAADAIRSMDTFIDQVMSDIRSSSAAANRHGEKLLQHFTEPWETRLGMAAEGFSGHGGAAAVGTMVADTLRTDARAVLDIGALKHLERLPLFVKGVDRDITSDITTRIIFQPLAAFTAQVVSDFPEFYSGSHLVKNFRRQFWNLSTLEWDEVEVSLPVANGKPLMLVPVGWARGALLMSARRYYGKSILGYVQDDEAYLGGDGKVIKSNKDDLRARPSLKPRGRKTNIDVTVQADAKGEDLPGEFTTYVDGKWIDVA
jgi:hypothetical protein